MKKILIPAIACLVLFLLQSCLKDKLTHTYTLLIPVYKSKDEVYANIKSNPPRAIESPGKIFIYGNYIFLNEINKGVHIIDNSKPGNPVEKTFIDIPGNLDIAVKGNILYADMYKDLVVVDISNPLQAKFLKYVPNIFPERYYPGGFIADNSRIIVDWIKKDTIVELKPSRNYIVYTMTPGVQDAFANGAAQTPGISGSMARFTVVNDYIYAVNSHSLVPVSIANSSEPVAGNFINAGFDIETIYPFKNKLFLGSMEGLYIFDISNPASPAREGTFTHARACDPVIADNNYAYVTLREGTNCGPTSNELNVVNVQNLQLPALVKTYAMTRPFGLTKDNNLLFICDGRDGLKMYDATDPSAIVLKKHITGIETYDAIAWNNNLIVVAKDGLYQYDYSNPNDLVERSKLTVNR